MLLSQALTQLKNLKSKASRTETYINSCAVYYEDQKPEYDYQAEMAARKQLNADILKLKTAIQVTNATTVVTYKGRQLSLAQLILMNAELRTEMAFINQQMNHSAGAERSYLRGRTKDDVKQVLAPGCNKQAFKAQLDELEREKEELETVLANANATTLVDL
jgi:hypothetical protein